MLPILTRFETKDCLIWLMMCFVGMLHGGDLLSAADEEIDTAESRVIAELVKCGAIIKRFDQRATGIEGLLVRLGDDYGVDRRIIYQNGTIDSDVVDLLGMLDDLTVEIRGTTLSDEGLKSICRVSRLQGLDVGGASITDRGIGHLNRLEKLVLLDLSLTAITDEGLVRLNPRDSLGTISLQGTKISDLSLEHLAKFKGLKSVFLPEGISREGAKKLQEALPRCRVSIEEAAN